MPAAVEDDPMRGWRDWPLVGRDDALADIVAALAGHSRSVVLTGPAGVGKSRLAREALAAAQAAGALGRWTQATRCAAGVPLGALADLLPSDLRSEDALELMRRSAQALRDEAAGRAIVLAVDDAHLLDPTSAALIHHLATTETASVVATVRAGEVVPDAVRSLWKDARGSRLDLRPLDEAETGALVATVLDGPVEHGALRWAFDTSQGNPLYVREVLLGALAHGALVQDAGLWRLSGRPAPSPSLIELVLTRVEELSQAAQRVIEVLSLGEPLRLPELVELTGSEPLAEAESRGMVRAAQPVDGGEVRLAHPLYGEVLRAGMPHARAHEIRLRLADVVQRRAPRGNGDALRIARWLLDAGGPLDLELLLQAAPAAIAAADPDLGARLASLALDGGAGAKAALVLARAHAVRNRHDDADATLRDLEGWMDGPEIAFEYLEQRVFTLLWGLQQPLDAQALLARAHDWWPDPAWRVRVGGLALYCDTLIAGYAGSVDASAALLSDPGLGEQTRRRLEPVHVSNLFYSGRTREAVAAAERLRPSIPLADQSDEFALMIGAIIPVEVGERWELHRERMADTVRRGVRTSDHVAAGSGAVVLGLLDLLAARFTDARRWMAEAESLFERHDALGALFGTWAFQVGPACALGDLPAAAESLRKAKATSLGPAPPNNLKAYLVRAEAWLAAAEGDRPGAQRLLLVAAQEMDDMPIYAALLTYEAMRAGAPARDVTAALDRLRGRCDARFVGAYAGHAAARAAGDGAALLRAADTFAAIGAFRYAMEAAAHAAEAYAAAGRDDSARRAALRSRQWHLPEQGGAAPVIRGIDAIGVELTERERQLVDMAARGLSNADIADQLVLSVRTVESHLYRAMQKLGVRDRRELPARRAS